MPQLILELNLVAKIIKTTTRDKVASKFRDMANILDDYSIASGELEGNVAHANNVTMMVVAQSNGADCRVVPSEPITMRRDMKSCTRVKYPCVIDFPFHQQLCR